MESRRCGTVLVSETTDPERTQASPWGVDDLWRSRAGAIFEAGIDAMALLCPKGQLAAVNHSMAALAGTSMEGLVGRRLDAIFRSKTTGASDSTELCADLNRIVADRRLESNWHGLLINAAGALTEVSVSHSPLEDETGLYSILIARPTIAPTARASIPASLVSVISHDLRTPLTSIKGCASMLLHNRDALDEEKVHDLLRIIDEQAERMRELIDSFADLAKIEAGTLRVRRRPMPMATVMERVVASQALRGRSLAITIPADLPAADVDPRRIEQAIVGLMELATVAQRAGETATMKLESRHGEVELVLSTPADVSLDGDADVTEGAAGIARKQVLLRNLVRGVVVAHGGALWAERSEGSGTIIHLTLPLAAQQPLPSSIALIAMSEGHTVLPSVSLTTLASLSAAQQPQRSKQVRLLAGASRVLVVDDDKRLVRLVQATLEAEGYEVRAAQDGVAALESLEAVQPDIIVLDLVMRDMDGFELCRRIRAFSNVPIIVLTAKAGGADKVRALDLGADDYLTKPFDPAELVARTRAALRRANVAGDGDELPGLVCDELLIDFGTRRVTMHGNDINLTPTEYKLLRHLAANAGRVMVHGDLLARVWGPAYREEVEYLRSYVRHLRRKIEDDPSEPRYILTQAGVGYYLRAPG